MNELTDDREAASAELLANHIVVFDRNHLYIMIHAYTHSHTYIHTTTGPEQVVHVRRAAEW